MRAHGESMDNLAKLANSFNNMMDIWGAALMLGEASTDARRQQNEALNELERVKRIFESAEVALRNMATRRVACHSQDSLDD